MLAWTPIRMATEIQLLQRRIRSLETFVNAPTEANLRNAELATKKEEREKIRIAEEERKAKAAEQRTETQVDMPPEPPSGGPEVADGAAGMREAVPLSAADDVAEAAVPPGPQHPPADE